MSQIKTKFIENLAVTNAKVATGIDAAKLADGSVSNTEFQYLGGVTSDIQTQIDGKAATTLSNLGTTSINANLVPDTNNTRNVGAPGFDWSDVYTRAVTSGSTLTLQSTGINDISIIPGNGVVVLSAGSGLRLRDSDGSHYVGIIANATTTANVTYSLPPADGTSGYVLSTNGSGILSWIAQSGGANTTLSNLTSPTAINQDLLPDANNTRDLGSDTLMFSNAYVSFIVDSTDTQAINVDSRIIIDTAGTNAADFDSRTLIDDAAGISIDYQSRALRDPGGDVALNYQLRHLRDAAGTQSLDWSGPDIAINADTVGSVARALVFYDNADTNSVSIKAPNTGITSYVLTLPTAQGGAGTVLQNNGSGGLSWATPASGATNNKATTTLNGTDITNQYIDLSHVAVTNSIIFMVQGSGYLIEGASYDYSVNYTGGAGGNTRITFLNDLATGGNAALVAGDVVQVQYQY